MQKAAAVKADRFRGKVAVVTGRRAALAGLPR